MIEIRNKAKCCGCGACASICPKDAITMQADEKGFYYPVVDVEKCIGCGLCDKVCAFDTGCESGAHIDKAYAMQHKDAEVLSESSSGGAFTAISDYVLSCGGKVYGAYLDAESFEVRHIGAVETQTRDSMRGSKYVQSKMVDIYGEIKQELKSGILVLFTGTPCQCAALCSYLGEKPENLITVDILCHGVSSNLLLQEHRKYWENIKQKKAVNYKYRSKRYGYVHTHEMIFEDGEMYADLKLRQLLKLYSLTMRESCYQCSYASRVRYGDFTIGDLWEAPELAQIYDHRGVSVVLVNTPKATRILEEISSVCHLITLSSEDIKQNALRKSVERPKKADEFWEDYNKNGYSYVLNKYAALTLKSNIYQNMLRIFYLTKTDKLYAFVKDQISAKKRKKGVSDAKS